jgi:anti-sigma regulatory factor (Ser/Thr protein kinase)
LIIQIQDSGIGVLGGPLVGADSIDEYQRPDRGHYHGLGLLIIKEFMDEVKLQLGDADQGTCVTLFKNREGLKDLNRTEGGRGTGT